MTDHCFHFVRWVVYYASLRGPVLEVGSYIEAQQDHLNLRKTFPDGTAYVGVDVIPIVKSTVPSPDDPTQQVEIENKPPGVDRYGDLMDESQLLSVADEVRPQIILCLYVLEHVWEIRKAAATLGALWRRHPESWIWVATHQSHPLHGTEKYPDYWRVTVPGMRRLMDEAGIPDTHIFSHEDVTNPEDIIAIRQPSSMEWSEDIFANAIRDTSHPPQARWYSRG